MPKWFDFSLISSETVILVSWQLRSHACLKISANQNTLRVQALLSHLLFSPHPVTLPVPTAVGGAGQRLSLRLTPSQDFQMWMQYKCRNCVFSLHILRAKPIIFLLFAFRALNQTAISSSVGPHLQLWPYLLMPAVTQLGFTDHSEQAEGVHRHC